MNFRFTIFALTLSTLLFFSCDGIVKEQKVPPLNTTEDHMTVTSSNDSAFFEAKGTGWTLSISKDRMRFSSHYKNFEVFNAPTTAPIVAADANVKRYRSLPEQGEIDVLIAADDTELELPYKVQVKIKRGVDSVYTSFEGRGAYVMDYRLHDLWVLESLEEQRVSVEQLREEFPYIEINTREKRFFGFAGCNRINGQIFSEQSLIRFTKIAQTKMLCAPPNKETEFLNALRSSTHFEIINNQLILSNPDRETMRFKKID
jgi:heat shock protein HslJ